MSPAALLADLQARGVTVEARGDRLRVEAPAGVLTDALKAQLAGHKTALLQLLAPPRADPVVAARAAAFRDQITEWVTSGRLGVPVLTLPGVEAARRPDVWGCLSCAAPIPADRLRCAPCRHAVELALGLPPVEPAP